MPACPAAMDRWLPTAGTGADAAARVCGSAGMTKVTELKGFPPSYHAASPIEAYILSSLLETATEALDRI